MTVALIAHYLGPRLGIGQYLERLLPPLLEELTSLNIPVKILASPNAFDKTPALQKLENHTKIVPFLDYSPSKRYAWVATSFSTYCNKENIKTVAWLSNPIVLPWHPPTLAVIHDVNEWKNANKYGNRLKTALRSAIYLDASIRFSRQIIAVSKATEKDLLHFRPQSNLKEKLKAIPNGVDSPLVNLKSVPVQIPSGPFLLSVGRIDPVAKRLPEAVALVSALRESSGEAWELHLVGGMNTTTQSAGEAFLKSIESLPWVTYHGHIPDNELAEWYRKASAIVFLSDQEGFGFPIAEAASFGRWVVVSQSNEAGIEAGGQAIIPVDSQNPKSGAALLLQQLQKQNSPVANQNLLTWEATAKAYAEEISAMVK